MATVAECIVLVLVTSVGLSMRTTASYVEHSNRIPSANDDIRSRSDYPDFDDMSSFFDFDLVPSSESDRDYDNQYEPDPNSESSDGRPRRNKYYYYYKSDGPRYLFDPNSPKKQLVTPGSHYKPEKDIAENVSTESKPVLNQAVVGPYQVSVVDADSPVLSNLGLNKDDLMKLSGHTKRSTINASMVGSDSVPPATYAENPRQDHPQSDYPPPHSNHPPPSYDHPNNNYAPERNYRPSEYYPADNHSPQRGYSSGQPPPQGSYDPKNYQQNSSPHSPPNSYNYPPPSRSYSPYPPPSPYAPKRSSEVPWRQVPATHTDWDDKQNKKPEPYHGYSHYQPPPSHGSSSSSSQYPKQSYGSSEKQGYRHSSYSKPTYSSPSSSSSDYHSQKHSASSSSDYHSHKHSPSSSGEYHSHKHSYPSSSYSSSAKAPSRAGAVSHEPSKPGITIRFKAKAPGHESGGHGGSGLSIPLSFNPLEVVKKLIPSLNPLNNKKVTIGITIENKKEPHIDYHSSY